MSLDNLFLILILAFVAWRVFATLQARRRVPQLKREGAQLVDVRGPGEFAAGHAPGSINIPLQDLDARAGELDPERWVVVACASGTRSAMAVRRLRSRGFGKVMNAGTWRNLG